MTKAEKGPTCQRAGCTRPADPDVETFEGYCEECFADLFPEDEEEWGDEQWDEGDE